ncbi:MAG TPA: hypothetical protein VJZ71_19555 [Phycisphaerae bacterium]|nr:hypothetical protein [Phycisphaerae bacterium]
MYGARAVLKEVVEAAPRADVRVIVVWLPMVETDNAKAAREAARMFRDERVTQFYDPQRLLGLAFPRDVFPNCIHDALRATPPEHPFHADLQAWAESPPDQQVMWDAVLFYDRNGEWGERPPKPRRWSKQVAFFENAGPGEPTATFFHNDCKAPPVDSDWHIEVRNGLQAIAR